MFLLYFDCFVCVKFYYTGLTAVSDENGHFEFDKIPYGEYIVREIEAPTGYILSDESYPVTISEDGEIIEITAVNKPITIEISKQDIYGNELVGAKMQLDNSDGKVVEKWTSDGTNHVVTELPAGDYTLKEIAAPDGYVIATDIRFTVDVYGKITVENVDATAVSENGNPLIVMVDEAEKISDVPDTPYTGDNHSNFAAYAMLGAASLIIAVLIITKKGKKHE